jgi:GntR family transcriptional regulator
MTMKAAYFINSNSGEPIYQQLTRQLKHSISTGSLKPGDRLPTVRELAENLVINPNTVARSYRELIAEGLLHGTQGSGTFVTASLPRVKPQERERRLQPFMDQLISEAALLGVRGSDLVKLIQQRIRERKEGAHDNDNGSHEILR